ncbi:hypothetical protein V2J09_006760 [Rumex salicifolius]
MQKKIMSFFKPSSEQKSQNVAPTSDDLAFDQVWREKQTQICIKYTRRVPTADLCPEGGVDSGNRKDDELGDEELDTSRSEDEVLNAKSSSRKVFNKKRKYAQFHLDLGQSDFLLHTCSACGIKYAKGDAVDEKIHNAFHKNYTHGIQFMGWRHERAIDIPAVKDGHIILVLNKDPPAQKKKIQEVVKIMEIELGEGWIYHDLCKVYLFISSRRVVGCLVAEEIERGYRLVTDSADHTSEIISKNDSKTKSTVLPFGGVNFHREVNKRASSMRNSLEEVSIGSIVCEEEALPACCGVRAIWVSPSNRRKHVASYLLDAARQSFCDGSTLDRSQIAFSQPTSAGRALASKYAGTKSFLVYRTNYKFTMLKN